MGHYTISMQGFIVLCLVFELWMVPLALLVMLLVQYGLIYRKGRHMWQQRAKRQSRSEISVDQQPAEVRTYQSRSVQ